MATAKIHQRVSPATCAAFPSTRGDWLTEPRTPGDYSTIKELASAEKINPSYLCRVLRVTLLARDFVEAIMDGRQREEVALPALMQGVAVVWGAIRVLTEAASS